jgi:hypothetical protein
MNILMVLTSHNQLGDTGKKNWLLAGGICCTVLCFRFFISFTVIFHSLQDNPVFRNYQEQHERHRAV